jgi:hypothetical protein
MGATGSYPGSTFKEVRDQVFSDPYPTLPEHVITLSTFYSGLSNLLLRATSRALNDASDLAPHFQKLVHPNGIALTGTWNITEDSPYTGYFRRGATGLIIVRSSVLLYKTKAGSFRGFAFAGKIFPTLDPNQRVRTADFFTIDVLSGTNAKHFTDVALTNEPPLGFNSDVFRLLGVIIATFGTFIRADYNPVYRPVYQIAELGLRTGETACIPRWIQVKSWEGNGKVDEPDYRNELRVENYPGGKLRFEISVASIAAARHQQSWHRIGHIELTESVTSDSCDHRLVFQHPKLRQVNYTDIGDQPWGDSARA